MVIRRQAYLSHLGSKEEWVMLFVTMLVIVTAASRSFYHSETVASDEWSYAKMRLLSPKAPVLVEPPPSQSVAASSPYTED